MVPNLGETPKGHKINLMGYQTINNRKKKKGKTQKFRGEMTHWLNYN